MKPTLLTEKIGTKFNWLTLEEIIPVFNRQTKWRCVCVCGTSKIFFASNVKRGNTVSCGCWIRAKSTKHGMKHTKLYDAWCRMLSRCSPNATGDTYKNYYGRGIRVAPEWGEFGQFAKDMGHPPPGTSLEREDNNGPYCKTNCVWATRKTQNNNKRSTIIIEFQGISFPIAHWAAFTGISHSNIYNRLHSLGWSVEKTLTTP